MKNTLSKIKKIPLWLLSLWFFWLQRHKLSNYRINKLIKPVSVDAIYKTAYVNISKETYDRFSSLKNRKDALAFSQSLGVEEINIDHNYTNKEKIKIDKKSYT